MNKATAAIVTLFAGACIALPVIVALQLAKRQSLDVEQEQALLLAGEVVRRADALSEQATRGAQILAQANKADPCSDAAIARMRESDLQSSYVKTFGYVAGDRLVCSAYGRHQPGLPLGPVSYVTSKNASVRIGVELPFAPGVKFIVADLDSYAAVMHPGLTTDIFTGRKDISLGVVNLRTGRVLAQRGKFDPAWRRKLDAGHSITFFDGAHVVAVLHSATSDYAAFAATPAAYLDQRTQDFALVLVPLGLLAGLLLAGLLLYVRRHQMSLPSVMRGALRRNEFFMLYQPVVDLRSGECVGAEALIRWRRPDGSSMLPDLFIPVAEDSGLIPQITERVLQLVSDDVTDLLRKYPDFRIGFNLSSADLQSERTVPLLRKFLLATRARPENVVVEATERGLLVPDSANGVIRTIRGMGIQVAIDDFGTGYSSLSYLTTLEVDYLKIDKSFVEAVDTDAATSHVALHIIEMAKSLNLAITAEGIETESQAAILRERGVQFGQGWLYGKPMTVAELTAWIGNRSLR